MFQLASLYNNFVLTWDVAVIAFLFIAMFLYGFSAGQRRLGLLLVSIYFAYVLIAIAPFMDNLGEFSDQLQGEWVRAGAFFVAVFVLFFVLAGSILRSSLSLPRKEEGKWWHLLILSIITAGFFSASVLALSPVSYYNSLSTITREVFINNSLHFFWAILGVVVLVLLKKTKKKT